MTLSGQVIQQVLCAETFGSYYYEDVATLQKIHSPETERWFMPSESEGFKAVRETAEVLSIGLTSPRGTAWGDCVGVSYAGKSGRRRIFRHKDAKKQLEETIAPWLRRLELRSLKGFDEAWKSFQKDHDHPCHPALSYGLTQAVLSLLSVDGALFRVIAREWQLPDRNLLPLPLQGSAGNNRFDNADKMIVRQLAALPHSQVDSIKTQVGHEGEVLLAYATWLRDRIRRFDIPGYRPIIHLDVHGALGKVFHQRLDLVADFLVKIEAILEGLPLRIESPILADSVDGQICLYKGLKNELAKRKSAVWVVADEWANTLRDIQHFAASGCVDMIHIKTPDVGSLVDIVDAVLYCREKNMAILLGGSCIETALSTRATMHIAMVTRPDIVLIKPGMGIDEGYMLCQGEMARIAAESCSGLLSRTPCA